jgi:hypothetical protein
MFIYLLSHFGWLLAYLLILLLLNFGINILNNSGFYIIKLNNLPQAGCLSFLRYEKYILSAIVEYPTYERNSP